MRSLQHIKMPLATALCVALLATLLPHPARAMSIGGGLAVTGDFRGTGHAEIATLSDPNDDGGLRITVLERTGADDSFSSSAWYSAGLGAFELSRMKATATDVDGDGKADIAVLYDDGGTSVRILVFRSTGTSFAYAGEWWRSDNYAWSRTKEVLSGNFSAVGRQGLLFVYQYDGFDMRIHYFESDGSRYLYNGDGGVYDSGPGQYDTARARLVVGRFTRASGPDQIASIYQYPNYRVRIHVFDPTPTGLQPVNGWDGVWDSGEGFYDITRAKVAAVDVGGDGKADLVALYALPDDTVRVQVFSGAENLALSDVRGWARFEAGAMPWDRTRLVAGDFDGDRHGDVALLSQLVDGTTHVGSLRAVSGAFSWRANALVTAATNLECASCWPLTGLPVAPGAPVSRRALAVRIDNAPLARPHYGTSEADIVFEMLVEGYVTRLDAFFHQGNPGTIGAVRSARLSDRYLTPLGRGGLAYSGATIEETALFVLDDSLGKYYDLNANRVGGYYRVSTRRSPYNEFTSSDGLRAALGGLPGGGAAVAIPHWDFLASAEHALLAGGMVGSVGATDITIPYRADRSLVRYRYDAATRTYARWQNDADGVPVREIDAANDVAIAPKNVVVVQTDIWETPIIEDNLGSKGLDMKLTGSGPAVVFRDGRRQEGSWLRASDYDAFTFVSRTGEVVLLSPGQTWVHVVPTDWTIPSN